MSAYWMIRDCDTMHISVIGTGYIGSVTGACLAEMGHTIVFVGRDTKKLDMIRTGRSPIFEPGLDTLLRKNRERIETTTDMVYAVKKTDLTFICVGTPPDKDGSSDLSQIREVSHTIGKALRTDTRFHTIITKSTVLPGTIENVIIPILEKSPGRRHLSILALHRTPNFSRKGPRSRIFSIPTGSSSGSMTRKRRNCLKPCTGP